MQIKISAVLSTSSVKAYGKSIIYIFGSAVLFFGLFFSLGVFVYFFSAKRGGHLYRNYGESCNFKA